MYLRPLLLSSLCLAVLTASEPPHPLIGCWEGVIKPDEHILFEPERFIQRGSPDKKLEFFPVRYLPDAILIGWEGESRLPITVKGNSMTFIQSGIAETSTRIDAQQAVGFGDVDGIRIGCCGRHKADG